MRIIDLSHTIKTGMPVYPGTEPPLIETPVTIESDGYLEKRLTLFSHTGTHVDAPAHIIAGAETLDNMIVGRFIGPALVIDVSNSGNSIIQPKQLMPYKEKIMQSDFLLLASGWDQYWGHEAYFANYPFLSDEAAAWLGQMKLKGIGIDACSFDPVGSSDLAVHHSLLGRGFILIENLTNLSGLIEKSFTFLCLPLKIESSDGSPTRAAALLP